MKRNNVPAIDEAAYLAAQIVEELSWKIIDRISMNTKTVIRNKLEERIRIIMKQQSHESCETAFNNLIIEHNLKLVGNVELKSIELEGGFLRFKWQKRGDRCEFRRL